MDTFIKMITERTTEFTDKDWTALASSFELHLKNRFINNQGTAQDYGISELIWSYQPKRTVTISVDDYKRNFADVLGNKDEFILNLKDYMYSARDNKLLPTRFIFPTELSSGERQKIHIMSSSGKFDTFSTWMDRSYKVRQLNLCIDPK
jgi:hypothetical protein